MRFRALRNSLHSEGNHSRNPVLSRAVHEVSVDVGMRADRSEEWHKALTILSRNVLPRLCKVRLLTPKHWVLTSYATQQMACKL